MNVTRRRLVLALYAKAMIPSVKETTPSATMTWSITRSAGAGAGAGAGGLGNSHSNIEVAKGCAASIKEKFEKKKALSWQTTITVGHQGVV